jgi:hypothetical protein
MEHLFITVRRASETKKKSIRDLFLVPDLGMYVKSLFEKFSDLKGSVRLSSSHISFSQLERIIMSKFNSPAAVEKVVFQSPPQIIGRLTFF